MKESLTDLILSFIVLAFFIFSVICLVLAM